jgi:hypothetical protein
MAGSTSEVSRVLDAVGEAVRSQQCILFLGAGVHAPPPHGSPSAYAPEQRPPARMSDKEPYDPIPLSLKFFLTGSTTLFLGYSLLDYNLRLLSKVLRWKIDEANVPGTYSVDVPPGPLILDVWQSQRRYVKFIAEDVWSFVPALYEVVRGGELAP